MSENLLPTIEKIITLGDEKKADNIRLYQSDNGSIVAEYVLVFSVRNNIHCRAIIEELDLKVPKIVADGPSNDFYESVRQSGNVESGWVILDLNSVIIHCIVDSIRDHYQLDELFQDLGPVFHY